MTFIVCEEQLRVAVGLWSFKYVTCGNDVAL